MKVISLLRLEKEWVAYGSNMPMDDQSSLLQSPETMRTSYDPEFNQLVIK